jgi:hypothetical protein
VSDSPQRAQSPRDYSFSVEQVAVIHILLFWLSCSVVHFSVQYCLAALGAGVYSPVAPTPRPTRSASVAPAYPSHPGSPFLARISMPGIPSALHNLTPAVPSLRSSTNRLGYLIGPYARYQNWGRDDSHSKQLILRFMTRSLVVVGIDSRFIPLCFISCK